MLTIETPAPVQVQGKYAQPGTFAEAIGIEETKQRITSVISTMRADRAGDVVVPRGCLNVQEYFQNPVVLWAHQRNLPPIGQCIDLVIEKDRIIATTQFSETSAMSRDLFRLYAEGIMRSWSIGFVPKQVRPIPAAPGRRAGQKIETWELLEYSAVPIPENPEAITQMIRKGRIESPEIEDWLHLSCICKADGRDVLSRLVAKAS
jgi:hypothetical protein